MLKSFKDLVKTSPIVVAPDLVSELKDFALELKSRLMLMTGSMPLVDFDPTLLGVLSITSFLLLLAVLLFFKALVFPELLKASNISLEEIRRRWDGAFERIFLT